MPIVKVQRPLSSNKGQPLALVYDHARARQEIVPMDCLEPHVLEALIHSPKAYFKADMVSGSWDIGPQVGDQPW